MKIDWPTIKGLVLLKAKFATTSVIATGVEYLLYFAFDQFGVAKKVAQIISYTVGMLVNFVLQKKYVFDLKRSLGKAFVGAMLVSLGGMALNFTIYSFLVQYEFFNTNHYLAKLGATGIVFFYNFYMKRYVFENKFI